MADVKISALSNASTPLAGTEVVPVVQGGVTYKTTLSNIAALAGAGSVTSVGMSVPTGLSVAGSPVTSSGTLAVTYAAGYAIPTTAKQTDWDTAYGWGNHASAGYLTSATAATTYQPLDSDLTAIAGLSGTSGLLKKTAANTWTLDTTAYLSGTVAITNGGTGGTTAATARSNLLPSYTSNATKVLAVNAGATDVEWITVSSGGSGTVTSITAGTGLSGGTITTSGTIALNTAYGDSVNPYAAKTANYILAAPNGSSGVPTFRALVAADVPTLNQNTTGTAAAIAGGAANQLVYQSGSGASTFVTAPTVTDTYLKWNGTTFTWATVSGGGSGTTTNAATFNNSGSGAASGTTFDGSVARTISYNTVGAPSITGTNATGTWSIDVLGSAGSATNLLGGAANRIAYQSGSNTTTFITAPTSSDTYLKWSGSAFTWATVSGSGGGGGSPNLDGGTPTSSYLAVDPIDGGTP